MRSRGLAISIAVFASLVAVTSAEAKVLVVPQDYPSIQGAVNAAAPGDTVDVRGGTYTEQVVVGKDLNLKGGGVGATVITSPATLSAFGADVVGRPEYAVVRIVHGAHVQMSGLTVTGPVPCGFVWGVLAAQSATLALTDARVGDMVPNATTCASASDTAVQFGLGDRSIIDGARGTTASGRVTGVAVDTFLDNGLRAVGPPGSPPTRVTFADDVVTAGTPSYPAEQFGIDVFLSAVAQITDNTISGGVCTIPGCGPDPINDFQAMGVLVENSGTGNTIAGNHVSGSDVGIYQYASANCCQISKNTLTDNRYFGIVIQDGNGATSENTITGGQVGLGVVASAVNTTGLLRGDKIAGTTVAPVREIECCGFTATAVAKAN
jgi:parallel beta-helix repeat protein